MLDTLPPFVQLVVALTIVIALMGGLTVVIKYLGLGGVLPKNMSKDTKRLSLIESLPLDARRRLVIIQRDEVQHLVILGLNSETVVESDINALNNTPEKAKNKRT